MKCTLRSIRIGIIASLSAFLMSCGSLDISDVAIDSPRLIPEQFFDGSLTASGVVKNRAGKVIRTFTADIDAYWQDGVGTLEEDFVFNDGEQQRRVWTLTRQPDGSYLGTAGDVTGDATIEVAGNQMNLDYLLQIPFKGRDLDIKIDDRMYLVEDDLLINESRMTKFGFTVGYILLVIEKAQNEENSAATL